MNNYRNLVLVVSGILMLSCSKSKVNDFTYEIFNNQKHLEVSRSNLLKLYELNKDELKDLLLALNYKETLRFSTKSELSYIQKTDTISGVFQIVSLEEEPNKILDISWTSMDGKDRFQKFRTEADQNGDLHIKKSDTYLLNNAGKKYMSSIIEVLSISKSIRIMETK